MIRIKWAIHFSESIFTVTISQQLANDRRYHGFFPLIDIISVIRFVLISILTLLCFGSVDKWLCGIQRHLQLSTAAQTNVLLLVSTMESFLNEQSKRLDLQLKWILIGFLKTVILIEKVNFIEPLLNITSCRV